MRPAIAVLLFALPLLTRAQQLPAIDGYVNAPGTTTYQVRGYTVHCDPASTNERSIQAGSTLLIKSCPQRRLGEFLTIYGNKQKKTATVLADRVEAEPPVNLAVSGYSIVDRILTPPTGNTATFRADGYTLRLTPQTKLTFAEGTSLPTLTTNTWVRYTGTLSAADGTVTAMTLAFSPNRIAPSEDKLRTRTDFDAASVKEEDRQSALSRNLLGRKANRLPASTDEDAQRRLSTIGRKLIPAFQQQLPATDPTRIDFRFQLVDDPKFHNILTSPGGIIQVPATLLPPLETDDELAAILSAAVAEVLEKQQFRAIPANRLRTAADIASVAGGLGTFGITSMIVSKNAEIAERHQQEQSTRTGLAFLQDAGYDPTKAPLAWWHLAQHPGKPLADTNQPYRTLYLYSLLYIAHPTP